MDSCGEGLEVKNLWLQMEHGQLWRRAGGEEFVAADGTWTVVVKGWR